MLHIYATNVVRKVHEHSAHWQRLSAESLAPSREHVRSDPSSDQRHSHDTALALEHVSCNKTIRHSPCEASQRVQQEGVQLPLQQLEQHSRGHLLARLHTESQTEKRVCHQIKRPKCYANTLFAALQINKQRSCK